MGKCILFNPRVTIMVRRYGITYIAIAFNFSIRSVLGLKNPNYS